MVEDNASYEGDWGSQPSHLCSKRQLSYTNGICLFLVSASSAFEPFPPSIAQAWHRAISPITNVGGRQRVTYITSHITSIAQAWLQAISPITSVGRNAASDIAPHTSA